MAETEAGVEPTEPTDTEAEVTAETEPEPTDIETETPTDPSLETDVEMTGMDAGDMVMPEAGLMTPVDAGDAMVPDAAGLDGGDGGDGGDYCPTCCEPANNHVDCDDPTPVCDPTSGHCVECFDADDFGCTGNTPRCKAGVTVSTNTCVQCLSAADCGDATPACQQNLCVPCSTADNFGCPSETPWCRAAEEPRNNACVECLDGADCPSEAPICESNVCIPCSLVDDAGCTQAEATRCLEGAVPKENTCVECLSGDDCSETRPFCVDSACDECTEASHCESSDLPVCDGSGTCSGCEGNTDCERFEGLPICDLDTGSCEECTANTDCGGASASYCDPDTLECSPCERDEDCAHISGLNLCQAGQCVECTVADESACGANSCNPATSTCTNTPRGSASLCESCVADSECTQSPDARCVPMTFQGSPRPGGYCLRRSSAGCIEPYATLFSATSLSGAASEQYCGINQSGGLNPANAVTCEAVRDLIEGVGCSTDTDCGDGQGGLCRTVGAFANRCTYRCGTADDCPSSRSCDDAPNNYCQ